MVQSGLLQETADLLVQNILDPESPPGRAIGYRQTIDYLCRPDPQMGDTKTFLVRREVVGIVNRSRRDPSLTQVIYTCKATSHLAQSRISTPAFRLLE